MTRATILLTALLVVSGCGGHKAASPEQVARGWSAALNRSDNNGAASLFAGGALVVQSGELSLPTHAAAVRWNAELPCGGTILSVTRQDATDVLVIFRLQDRPGHACDAPGQEAAAIFRVRNGKIVLWHQTDVPGPNAFI